MLAAVFLASAVTTAYLPPDAFGLWDSSKGLLTIGDDRVTVKPFAEAGGAPRECVIVQQNPGIYQFAVTCDDGENYTLTMRDTGGKGAIEDVTLEFDGLIYTKVPER